MFPRNRITRQQNRSSLFYIGVFTSLVLICFCADFADAASVKASYKYQKIKAIAKKVRHSSEPENLEKLVEEARAFVAAHPKHKRVDEVYYHLGKALVQLDRAEEGVKVFEEFLKDYRSARYVEQVLLELGLTYDKLSEHDKADAAYQKLVDHPKYGSRSLAKFAKQLLEQDRSTRKGQLPRPPGMRNLREWIGQPAPDFQVTDLKGEALSLKKYRGQVILLDFWATWCGPCIQEIPNVKRAYQKYKDQKFQIIGISLDRSIEPLAAYIEKEGLGWIHYWDNSHQVSEMYKVRSIPSTFLIDGEGVIRKADLRGAEFEIAVAELVKENLAKPAETEDGTDSQ